MTDSAVRILDEPPVYLPEVAESYRVHLETIGRWVRRGLLVNGRRIRLEAVKFGKWRTSRAALVRFAAAILAAQAQTAEPDVVTA
jgi:hypothetical protein